MPKSNCIYKIKIIKKIFFYLVLKKLNEFVPMFKKDTEDLLQN